MAVSRGDRPSYGGGQTRRSGPTGGPVDRTDTRTSSFMRRSTPTGAEARASGHRGGRRRGVPAAVLALALAAGATAAAPGSAVAAERTTAGPVASAAPATTYLYSSYALRWRQSADLSAYPVDQYVHRYDVTSGATGRTFSFGGTPYRTERVVAARTAGVFAVRSEDTGTRLLRYTTAGRLVRAYGTGTGTGTGTTVLDADAHARSDTLVTLERPKGQRVGAVRVFRQTLAGTKRRLVASLPWEDWGVARLVLSGAGRTVHVLHRDPCCAPLRVTAVDLVTGRLRTVVHKVSGARDVDVSPDGKRLLLSRDRDKPLVVTIAGGRVAPVPLAGDTARFAPDGRSVYVTRRGAVDPGDETRPPTWRNGTVRQVVTATGVVRTVRGVVVDVDGATLEVLRS